MLVPDPNTVQIVSSNTKKTTSTTATSPEKQQLYTTTAPTTTTSPCTHTSICKQLHDLLLELLDVVLSCLVVAPCVIAYWRGTWELMGVLIFPGNVAISAAISFLIGSIGHLIFTLTQGKLSNHIHPDKHRLTYYVISRFYTAIFGIVCVNMWRGSWIICDWLTSTSSLAIICIVTLVAVLFLIATRTVRNLSAAPYTVTMDHKSDYFEVGTMFKVSPSTNLSGLYVLDTLFSIFVIGVLVVIAWRGLWGIMDLTFFPGQVAKSAWGSLVIGYMTVLVTFLIQPALRCLCDRFEGMTKLIICDIFYLMTFFGAVNAWRGIWNLLDVYFYPDDRLLSLWLTHLIPFLILAALKCSNSILVRGVFVDAEEPGGECVNVPINYIRLHFQRERDKRKTHGLAHHQYHHHPLHTPHHFQHHLHLKQHTKLNIEQEAEEKLQSAMNPAQIV